MDRYQDRIDKPEPTDRGSSAAATPAATQANGSPASRRNNRARPGESSGPKKAQAAQAAQFPNASRVPPASPRPGSLEHFLACVAEDMPAWSRRRRIRALQELLVDAKRILVFAIDELERERSGVRLSEKVMG